MRKPDALNFVLSASATFCFCGATLNDNDNRFSMTQATVQQPCAARKMTQASAFQLISADQNVYPYSNERVPDGLEPGYTAQIDFSQRLEGGTLLRFEFGLIVVKPTSPPESLQPTALTTDAIITASVRSKIAGEAQLSSGNFEIQTDDGVVTIRSKGESLDQAAEVINLALCVPDVRQIVYTMPSAVWKTAGGGKNSEFRIQNPRDATCRIRQQSISSKKNSKPKDILICEPSTGPVSCLNSGFSFPLTRLSIQATPARESWPSRTSGVRTI